MAEVIGISEIFSRAEARLPLRSLITQSGSLYCPSDSSAARMAATSVDVAFVGARLVAARRVGVVPDCRFKRVSRALMPFLGRSVTESRPPRWLRRLEARYFRRAEPEHLL
ncbi:hypothetical protein [Paraburkholderia terrae]|uniref:hypothetical protein n=1 Tax=Paraburkholderia terrae TaxID=311230 RepID=UPI0020C04BF6|nr:hypothetical protein [Paraburkholderia terrae]